jgi:hypothetical protein
MNFLPSGQVCCLYNGDDIAPPRSLILGALATDFGAMIRGYPLFFGGVQK